MIQTFIGRKVDQTQKFLENGRRIPVSEIAVSDNTVVQVKTVDTDKYSALQIGYETKKKPTKALIGHAKKAGLENVSAKLREVRLFQDEELRAGDVIAVEAIFKPGDIVKVTGTSKGKGFAGGVKRHNFKGGPKTHGQSDRHRAPGSIGQTTTPGRVYKGKRMAGHMGHETVTVSNLTIVDVDAENKKLYILGLVPGHKNALVAIEKTGESKKFVPLLGKTQAEPAVTEEKKEEVVAEVKEEVKTLEPKGERKEVKEAEEKVEKEEVKEDK